MKRNKYRLLSTSVLRAMLSATSSWPLCVMTRGQRLAINAELIEREVAEVLEDEPASWKALPVEGSQ